MENVLGCEESWDGRKVGGAIDYCEDKKRRVAVKSQSWKFLQVAPKGDFRGMKRTEIHLSIPLYFERLGLLG